MGNDALQDFRAVLPEAVLPGYIPDGLRAFGEAPLFHIHPETVDA